MCLSLSCAKPSYRQIFESHLSLKQRIDLLVQLPKKPGHGTELGTPPGRTNAINKSVATVLDWINGLPTDWYSITYTHPARQARVIHNIILLETEITTVMKCTKQSTRL